MCNDAKVYAGPRENVAGQATKTWEDVLTRLVLWKSHKALDLHLAFGLVERAIVVAALVWVVAFGLEATLYGHKRNLGERDSLANIIFTVQDSSQKMLQSFVGT